jgi:3-deoxy-D-manno-octulosonic-acid transferase/heptosyltransferase-1
MGRELKRIALVRLGSLGDIVHALPVAYCLRREFPQAHLAWVVEAEHRQLLEGCNGIDELIVLDTRSWRRGIISKPWREIAEKVRQLRAAGFDLVLELQGLIKSGVVAYISGAKRRLGFSRQYCREPVSACFTNEHVSPGQDEVHIIDKNLAFIRYLGLRTSPWEFDLPSSAADIHYIDNFLIEQGLGTGRELVGINPGAGWVTKRWGAERYARLGDRLIGQLKQRVILIWGPGERELVEDIARRMTHVPIIACPTSVTQLVELTRRCRLFVAGDTGPLHLAAALGVPTVALYGPSDPARNGPYGSIHETIYHRLECSGCYKRQCNKLDCMQKIKVEEVLSATERLLNWPSGREVIH